MIPINGTLVPLGFVGGLTNNPASTVSNIPSNTTHFSFAAGTNNKTYTHVHATINGIDCVVPTGIPIKLFARGYTPTIATTANKDTFVEVTFYKIEPNPSFS